MAELRRYGQNTNNLHYKKKKPQKLQTRVNLALK